MLSRFVHLLSSTHWLAIKRIHRSLKGTQHHIILISKNRSLSLIHSKMSIDNLLAELHQSTLSPTICCDNLEAIYVWSKHLKIDFHYVRDQVFKKELQVTHVHSSNQLADSLTKPLPRSSFRSHQSKIDILDGSTISQGIKGS